MDINRTENIKVLVIDDNEMELKLYFNSLAKHFTMSFAGSAKDAWHLLHQEAQPDLIILDIMMPNEDGLQLCNRLKENTFTQDIPIIFISSLTGPTIKSQAFELGGADFVTKPPMITELVARIKRHVAVFRKTKELESLIYVDPVTHLPNKSKFKEVLTSEWSRCARYWHHLSLLLVDVYGLKALRDESGTEAYNDLLSAVALSLGHVGSRPGDMLSYLDEGHFSILLPDCSLSGAVSKAEEILQLFADRDYASKNIHTSTRLEVTVGIAVAAPAGGGNPNSLFKLANDLLFEGQQRGRNRIYHNENIIGFDQAGNAPDTGEPDISR